MKNKTSYIILIFSLLLCNCIYSTKENSNSKSEKSKPNQQALAEGFQLTEENCFPCHSPSASMEDRIAPTMETVKRHYIKNNVSYEQFTQEVSSFLKNPSEEESKMPEAIKQFDLMPEMIFSDEEVSKMTAYIYFSELETPDWFEKQNQEEKEEDIITNISDLSPVEKGQYIAMKTKAALGKNLQEAINAKGTENAISFCSTIAIPLTDSMAISFNTTIKRVSDKNRNPENKANKVELSYIEETKLAIAQGKTPKPQLTVLENRQIAYYPIMTNKMCLQCHGQLKTEILPKTLARIKEMYPNDLATGYKTNELRGIWVVEMEK